MTLGRAPEQEDIFQTGAKFCDGKLSPTSIYGLLHRKCHQIFADDAFEDLFEDIGRRSVPPRIVAVVMVLQRLEGLSDRDAVDRFTFDLRWKYAAGGLELEYPNFVHTVLVNMRARLRASDAPNRVFDIVLKVAKEAGIVGRRRVLDSTALYDAVATQDTVTMIRSAIRQLLRAADAPLAAQLRGVLKRDDDYAMAGKPACDWDDAEARENLVDALAKDAHAALAILHGLKLTTEVAQAGELLATVVGQDVEMGDKQRFLIVRRVAPNRVISTVDPEARHGHKTAARSFDGYKGHIAIDPDSEIITASEVTAGNVADGDVTQTLLAEILPKVTPSESAAESVTSSSTDVSDAPSPGTATVQTMPDAVATKAPVEVLGDASYGTAEVLLYLEAAEAIANVKVQAPSARDGHFSKDAFRIDLERQTVTCPAGRLVQIRLRKDGAAMASFGAACGACPLAPSCSTSKSGRNIRIHPHERILHATREHQKGDGWRAHYRATRPKVERKIAHLMRHRHGGRRARVRGTKRVRQDFALLCASVNLCRIARLERPTGPNQEAAVN